MAKYLQDVWKIPGHHFGYMIGLCALSFTGSLLWTMISDKTNKHKTILAIATFGYAFFFLLLRTEAFLHSTEGARLFFVAFCFGTSNFCSSALYPLLDCQVFKMLSKDARYSKALFGRQRLFGTLGQSFITLLNGHMITKFGFDAIFINLILSTVAFLFLLSIGPHDTNPLDIQKSVILPNVIPAPPLDKEQPPLTGAIKSLLFAFDYPFFLVVILIAGTARAVAGNYLPQYFDNEMGLTPWSTAVMLQTRIITEIMVFFLGRELLQIFGVQWMLFIAQLSGLIRVSAYVILPTHYPWTLMPLFIELLKGINNGCLVSAGVRYVHDHAPPGYEATAQGIFSGIHNYLANATSGFFGGAILHLYRESPSAYQILFKYTSLLSLSGLVLFSLRQLLFFGNK
jgi:hypothetical protein